MTRIADLLAGGRTYSFEFFPPRTPEAEITLEMTLAELELLRPSFVSVTYGAGGSTRERTHDLVVSINTSSSMTAMAHLTCAAHTRADLVDILGRYDEAGVENILALGGDPPADLDLPAGELTYAHELVELARQVGSFCMGVAAHPELHPRSPDRQGDRTCLAAKLKQADFAITQFFFRLSDYESLVDDLAKRGMHKPVIAGIMPVTSLALVQRMAQLSGCEVPPEVVARVEAVAHDPADVRRVGVELATELCRDVLAAGAPGLHFYTLNRSTATRDIYTNLGLTPTAPG